MRTLKNIGQQKYILGILLLALITLCYSIKYDGQSGNNRLWYPTWLLFGPFLYFSFPKKTGFRQHLMPFMLMSSCYIILPVEFARYYELSFLMVPLSLSGYIALLLPEFKRKALREEGNADMYFFIAAFFVSLSLMCTIKYICSDLLGLSTGINYFAYINYLLSAMIVFTLAALIANYRRLAVPALSKEVPYGKSALKPELVQTYIQQIEGFFAAGQPYLQYNLSLDMLSKQLDIPKAHLSQVFNFHLGKNFYGYLATYRIAYSLALMQHPDMTIEAIAHECGYSSKTTFNKYFRTITGLSPAAYLNQRIHA